MNIILSLIKTFYMLQMTAAEAREVCQHWWMKEALDILVERLSPRQQQEMVTKEEDVVLACALS